MSNIVVAVQSYSTPPVAPFGRLEVGQALTLDGAGNVYVGGFGNYPGNFTGVRLWKYDTTSGAGGLLYSISGASGQVYDVAANSTRVGILYQNSAFSEISPTGTFLGTFSASENSVNLASGSSAEIYSLTKTNLRRFN